MKVTGPGVPNPLKPMQNDRGSAAGRRDATPVRHDQVQLSSGAAALAEAHKPHAPDTTRVERLKLALKNGTFKVDAKKIAEKMLAEERGPREA